MSIVIEDGRESFFESNEHYLKFRTAWKQYIADGKHKSAVVKNTCGTLHKGKSNLTCVYHLIYNGLRNRHPSKSFTPIISEGKLESGYDDSPYRAYNAARARIKWLSRTKYYTSAWVQPFGDTVTQDMLKRLSDVLESIELG